MTIREEEVAEAIKSAEEILDPPPPMNKDKPRLLVDNSNPDRTVSSLRDILVDAGELYDRGVPARLAL
jgi:hypothetical protein